MYVEGWERRSILAFHVRTHWEGGVLSRILEGPFYDLSWKPGKVRAILGVVDSGGLDFLLVDLIKKIAIREDVVFEHQWSDHVAIDDCALSVVAELVEQLVGRIGRKVGNGIVLFFVIVEIIVKNGWVPFGVGSEDNMWKCIPFPVGVGTLADVGKTTLNVDRDVIPINGLDPFLSANASRFVIHILFVPFELTRGVNCLSLLGPGVLVHDDNDVTTLGTYDSTGRNDGDINNLMIIDPLDIHLLTRLMNDTDIVAGYATIGATIDKSATADSAMIGGNIESFGHVDSPICLAVDMDVGIWWRNSGLELFDGRGKNTLKIARRKCGTLGEVSKKFSGVVGIQSTIIGRMTR
jgi:hypothetical protein